MTSVLMALLATLRGVVRSRAALHLEVLALRHQVHVLQRSRPRRLPLAQATVAKYMTGPSTPPSQSWRTFLANHVAQIAAADFFVVPTATYRLLFVLIILAHDRPHIVFIRRS